MSLLFINSLALLLLFCHHAFANNTGTADITTTPDNNEGLQRLELEHSFDMKSFHSRASFQVADNISPATIMGENSISSAFIPSFKDVLANNGLYRIRFKSSVNGPYVSTAIPACELQKSGFREQIDVHTDDEGNIIGLSYSSPVIALPRPCDPHAISEPVSFITKLRIVEKSKAQAVPLQATGPRPATLGAESRVHERATTGDNEPRVPPQSFVRKYWYIIVPMVLMMMFGIAGEEEKGTKKKKPEPGASSSGAK